MDEAVRKEQLARLRAAVEEGERDIAEGRYTAISSKAELRGFFDDIKRRGRAALKRSPERDASAAFFRAQPDGFG